MGGDGPPAPRRPAPARLAPQRLAAARGGAREGLAWLGRPPEARASLTYRLARLLGRAVLFGLFGFRVEALGREHVPLTGGYLLVGAAHRGWMDPFLVLHALPTEPRAWFLGSGPSAFDRRWKEWALRRVGGMLPVWRGGVGVEQHVASAEAVLRAGGVFVLFPEGGVAGPPDRPSPFRVGAALIALRTGAPILPFAMAGSAELYRGRRLASRALPATSAAALLGPAWDGVLPPAGSRAELDLARALTERFEALLAPPVAELHGRVMARQPGRRRWPWLTWLFLRRPGRSAETAEKRAPAGDALAVRLGPAAAKGGLMGGAPTRAAPFYRAIVLGCRLVQTVLRLRFELEGAERLPRTPDGHPAGGWIAAGLPHRTWIDPFVVALSLPLEPRLTYFGDGPAIFRSPFRRFLFSRIGGVIPIWPGGGRHAFDAHAAAAVESLAAGTVFVVFPEVGPPAPLGEARRIAPGLGYFALRSGAPIVPLVLGGSEELYLGRRIRLRALPAISPREAAGLAPDTPLPPAGSAAERRAAHAIAAALHERTAGDVAELHRLSRPPRGERRPWRRLTTLFH